MRRATTAAPHGHEARRPRPRARRVAARAARIDRSRWSIRVLPCATVRRPASRADGTRVPSSARDPGHRDRRDAGRCARDGRRRTIAGSAPREGSPAMSSTTTSRRGRRRSASPSLAAPSPTPTATTAASRRLVGRAVLPVETYAPGPHVGRLLHRPRHRTGSRSRCRSQPVEGFSAIVEGRHARRVPGDGRQRVRQQGQLARLPDPRLLPRARLQDGRRRHRAASASATSSSSAIPTA